MNLFHRLGALVARYRHVVIVAWAALLIAAVPFAPQLPGALRSGGFTLDDLEASKAEQALAALNVPPSAMVIVLQSETDAHAGDPAFEQAAATALANVPTAQHVTGVLTHVLRPRQVSADGKTVYEIVTLDLPPDDSPEALQPVENAITPVPGLKVMLAGGPAFYGDIQVLSENDLRRSEFISLPLAALALLLVFGSVVAAGVPIVVGGSAVVVALGALFFVAQQTALSIFVLNLATLLGLGLGVDYALLLTSRFREELKARGGGRLPTGKIDQESVNDAVAATVATAGRAVFFSGLTVLLGLIGLILFEFMVLRSVGIAGAMVVGLAVASAVTLLPAVLATLGPRVDAFPVRLPWRRLKPALAGQGEREGAWGRLARRVMRRPLLFFIPTLTLLLVLGSPFLHVRFNAPGRVDPAAGRPVEGGVRSPRLRLRRGRVRAGSRGRQDDWPCDRPEQRRSPVRLLAPARRGSTGHAGGGLRRCRSAPEPRAVPAALLGTGRAGRPVRRPVAGGHDQGRPCRVHRLHALRPEPGRGPAARRRHAHTGLERRAAAGRQRALSAAARQRSSMSLRASAPISRAPRCSS